MKIAELLPMTVPLHFFKTFKSEHLLCYSTMHMMIVSLTSKPKFDQSPCQVLSNKYLLHVRSDTKIFMIFLNNFMKQNIS